MVSGIVRQQSLVYGRFQRMVECSMDAVDGGGRESAALTGPGVNSASLF